MPPFSPKHLQVSLTTVQIYKTLRASSALTWLKNQAVTYKLVSAINIDELSHLQKFDFIQKFSRQGRFHSDIFGSGSLNINKDTVNTESSLMVGLMIEPERLKSSLVSIVYPSKH